LSQTCFLLIVCPFVCAVNALAIFTRSLPAVLLLCNRLPLPSRNRLYCNLHPVLKKRSPCSVKFCPSSPGRFFCCCLLPIPQKFCPDLFHCFASTTGFANQQFPAAFFFLPPQGYHLYTFFVPGYPAARCKKTCSSGHIRYTPSTIKYPGGLLPFPYKIRLLYRC